MSYHNFFISQNVCLDCKHYNKKEHSCKGKKKHPHMITIECPKFEQRDKEQMKLF